MSSIQSSWKLRDRIRYRLANSPNFVYNMHKRVYKLTGGRIGKHMNGMPVLLLTTTGRKTGKQRTKALLYLQDGEHYVIVASNSGRDVPPAWWFNLRAKPSATIQVGSKRIDVAAHIASADVRKRLWSQFVAKNPFYAAFQENTSRQLGPGGAASGMKATRRSTNDPLIAASIVISFLGMAIYNVLEFGSAGLYAPENGTIPMLILTTTLALVWWNQRAPRRSGAILLAALGLLHLIGGAVISTLPLGALPFEPEQSLEHYTSHLIYGVAQLPLIWLAIWAIRKSRVLL